jgi:UDP-N-acetylmuramate--alanine ligase
VIGGRLTVAGANARLGTGDYIVVVEADESDASFRNHGADDSRSSRQRRDGADHMETYRPRLSRGCAGVRRLLHAALTVL